LRKENTVLVYKMNKKSEFNEKLIKVVDDVLKETFGTAGLLVYTYLENQSVKREQIPERLQDFADCLKNFSAGGTIVETLILRNLYSSFGLEFKQNSGHYSFADKITKLRNSFQP